MMENQRHITTENKNKWLNSLRSQGLTRAVKENKVDGNQTLEGVKLCTKWRTSEHFWQKSKTVIQKINLSKALKIKDPGKRQRQEVEFHV